jgi:hypothetical protein
MSVLADLGAYLTQQGVGTPGVDLFLGTRPDMPDDVTTLYEYSGAVPEYTQAQASPSYVHPQVQVVARAHAYPDAEMMAWNAWNKLSFAGVTINGNLYVSVKPEGTPGLIGRDQNDRVLIAFNVAVMRTN